MSTVDCISDYIHVRFEWWTLWTTFCIHTNVHTVCCRFIGYALHAACATIQMYSSIRCTSPSTCLGVQWCSVSTRYSLVSTEGQTLATLPLLQAQYPPSTNDNSYIREYTNPPSLRIKGILNLQPIFSIYQFFLGINTFSLLEFLSNI